MLTLNGVEIQIKSKYMNFQERFYSFIFNIFCDNLELQADDNFQTSDVLSSNLSCQ